MKRSLRIAAASGLAGALILGGALPANAGYDGGSRSCASGQVAYTSSSLSVSSGATSTTQTTHTHASSGSNYTQTFVGLGTKTYNAGLRTITWTVTSSKSFLSSGSGCTAGGV